ncbi:hypothetical protein BDZ89DRAFT_746561 [Hymenopellis radicata]|nr:hypothetical protein BDZ89DRAFT_746561 [Hymenopellis radicata]
MIIHRLELQVLHAFSQQHFVRCCLNRPNALSWLHVRQLGSTLLVLSAPICMYRLVARSMDKSHSISAHFGPTHRYIFGICRQFLVGRSVGGHPEGICQPRRSLTTHEGQLKCFQDVDCSSGGFQGTPTKETGSSISKSTFSCLQCLPDSEFNLGNNGSIVDKLFSELCIPLLAT